MTEEIEVEVAPAAPSVSEWLTTNPLAAHAGSTLYSWYESSKGCYRLSDYALDTIESSVKYAAGTAVPLVKKLDGPIHAVDSFAARQLVKLEEKVPAIKSQPDEVVTYLTESKEAISNKITDSHTAVSSRITEGKEAISSRVVASKDAVVSKIHAGTDALAKTRAVALASEGKDALATQLSNGKEAVTARLTQGKDAIYSTVQSGATAVANTRAGALVGSGVDRTILATESLVDYIIPAEENEKELLAEEDKIKEPIEMTSLGSTNETNVTNEVEEEEGEVVKEEVEEEEEEKEVVGRVVRIKTLSRKVKLRIYYRSMRHLQTVQQQSKSTLEQLKTTIDLLKVAKDLREKAGQQYGNVTSALKDLEGHVKDMLSRSAQGEDKVNWLPDESEDDDTQIQWLKPQPVSRVQASLDYAKQLSEKVYGGFKSVSGATSYLPHQLKGGATQAYDYAQEMYTNLKSVKAPTDLSKKALDRISEIVDTQLGYVRQLGTYLTSVLQRGRAEETPADDMKSEDGEHSEDEEEDDDDLSVDHSTSQPPGSESDSDSEEEPEESTDEEDQPE